MSLLKRLPALIMVTVSLMLLLTACKIPFFEPSGPTIKISNAQITRDEVTDLPSVTVDWKVTFPSDAYPQTADTITVGCTMTQKYATGPRSFAGTRAWGAAAPTNKGPFTGTARIDVPDSGKYIKGKFYVTCQIFGIADETVSNELSVNVPASSCDSGAPPLGNSFSLKDDCETPPATEEPTYPATIEPTPPETTGPPVSTYDYDAPFAYYQWIVHATGHGTYNGDVKDDFYTLIGSAPRADGGYEIPDGSGGTYSYSSDYNSGPYANARAVCTAAYGLGLPNTMTWTVSYNYNRSFDCTGVY